MKINKNEEPLSNGITDYISQYGRLTAEEMEQAYYRVKAAALDSMEKYLQELDS
jgi:hypothetical protein